MNRTVQQITQQLIQRLPDNKQFYRPDDLSSFNFPSFLVQRIRIELKRNLAESMSPPETDWANTDSSAVQEAWGDYVEAIQGETYLPTSYSRAVIETAVADILDILVQPRQNIPEVIFGPDDELPLEELSQRVLAVVVYRQFGKLLPRYMQKKQLHTLSKQRCQKIIISADQKLTARYTPLNWTQMLEPLFILQNGQVDANLLRLFFEDKNDYRRARRFEHFNEHLDRAQVIEVLSSPDHYKTDERPEEPLKEAVDSGEDSQVITEQLHDVQEKVSDKPSQEFTPNIEKEKDDDGPAPLYERFYSGSEDQGHPVEEQPEGQQSDSMTPMGGNGKQEVQEVKEVSAVEEEPDISAEGDTNGNEAEAYPNWYSESNEERNTLNAIFVNQEESTAPEKPESISRHNKSEPGSDSEWQTITIETEVPDDQNNVQDEDSRQSEDLSPLDEKTPSDYNFDEPEEDLPMWKRFFSDDPVSGEKEDDEQRKDQEPLSAKESEDVDRDQQEQSSVNKKPKAINPFNPEKSQSSSASGARQSSSPAEYSPPKENRRASDEKPKRRNPFNPDETSAEKSSDASPSENAGPNKARFLNKPIFGGTGTQKPNSKEVQKLKERLADKRKMFVKAIFKGSGRAYEQAVVEISTYQTWQEASRYIQKEIFKRNLVNIYSEQAVDFTDRLHDYFTEKQNRN